MTLNTKKAVDVLSRAATFTGETEETRSSERAKLVLEQRPRQRLPSTLEGSAILSYADIGFFFVFVSFLAMFFRIGVHLHVLSQARLDNPPLPLQLAISLSPIDSFHSLVRWLCFLATGAAFGWIRVKSGSNAASTLMHAIYKPTLFLCQVL